MPISWNEIKDRAVCFSRDWGEEASEDAEAKSFWDAFFNIFGISRRRVASFEHNVKKIDGKDGYIDLLWRGILLVEHKSRGKDLDRAFAQAKDYFPGLKDRDLPRYILVSDFARFRLYDLEEDTATEFPIQDLYKNLRLFGFIAGYHTTVYKEQDPVNMYAAERMGRLHDKLKSIGYSGHVLEVYLVRLLFCLFAEDTSVFERRQFQDLIEQRTAEDGQDLAQWLCNLFEVMDTPLDNRLTTLDEQLAAFPYVNGGLYEERLPTAAFDRQMRDMLLECCALDWSRISPAIFGSLFQSVMDPVLRRNLGAHYTSEKNILKLICPLFLDDLRTEFEQIKGQSKRLAEFHHKLARLKFLDPACGCGNFLVIAYRELRLLELDVMRALYKGDGQRVLDIRDKILCDVDQFYGIEIEEFPAQIAQTALWLTDHQMNMRISEEFGRYFVRLPLNKSPTIVHGNALRIDWREIIMPSELSYILGNPPFGGAKYLGDEQRRDMDAVFSNVVGAGLLDFVTAWYYKAADYMDNNTEIKAAFVSTNSITQGEQVAVLWSCLLRRGVKIHFAHRTFQWSNEGRGKAAVHCVIIGFALHDSINKRVFGYETPQSEPQEFPINNINPYLVDAPDTFVANREKPLSAVPTIGIGNKPIDDGNYLFTTEQKNDFIRREPMAKKYFRRWLGADEFLNGYERWCLLLADCPPEILTQMPEVIKRINNVRHYRLKSKSAPTRTLASTPTKFHVENIPNKTYLFIPRVSSERRDYIPMGFVAGNTLTGDTALISSGCKVFHFGILSSAMHMAWTRSVCGRLKSDYRYSAGIVYNNFPWPESITPKQQQAIETAAQAVLDARAAHKGASLAMLYDPVTMPPLLVAAHRRLDMAVDEAYSKKKFTGDADRVALLFDLYNRMTLLPEAKKPRRHKEK